LLSRNVFLKQKNHGRHYYICAWNPWFY